MWAWTRAHRPSRTLVLLIGFTTFAVLFYQAYFYHAKLVPVLAFDSRLHFGQGQSIQSPVAKGILEQHQIHARLMAKGAAVVLGDEEIKLSFKYWELIAWLKKLSKTSTAPPPMPFQFGNHSLWGQGFVGVKDKVLAQSVWHLQLIAGNYVRKYLRNASLAYNATIGTPSKRIFIGNMKTWPDWTVLPGWESSGRISGCFSTKMAEEFPELEPNCELVETRPKNWTGIDLTVSYLYQTPLNGKYRVFPPVNIPWFIMALESPAIHSFRPRRRHSRGGPYINSYWSGSMVQRKYGKWIYFDPTVRQKKQGTDYSTGKSKMVAMLVSNCNDMNGRIKYAHELRKYIPVDIYGKCGNISCGSRFKPNDCDARLRDYRFYLSFENSNCQEYVTEKLDRNALENSIIPIVMGAPRSYYQLHAPQNSYIHVEDFASPKALASYLLVVGSNRTMYNSYFQWKGTGKFVERVEAGPQWLCRVCAMLYHSKPPDQVDVIQWLPDFKVNGEPLCLPRGRWYWDRGNNN